MQSFAGLMQHECADCLPPPALDYLNRICEASNRLDRLITDALNYNKVVRENLPVVPVDLGRLLRGMVQTYPNLQPPAADITIELTRLLVMGNESLLTQCFGNLLDNAVKFVAPGVRPLVRVWAEELRSPGPVVPTQDTAPTEHGTRITDQGSALNTPHSLFVRIWVEDNGIGIPKEAQERIFRMFQRMHSESQYPGTGIGLTIVKKAVERMRGRICLDSEPGKGTRVYVELSCPDPQSQESMQNAA
jgi:signal transduction histidine kinase